MEWPKKLKKARKNSSCPLNWYSFSQNRGSWPNLQSIMTQPNTILIYDTARCSHKLSEIRENQRSRFSTVSVENWQILEKGSGN